MIQPIDRKKKVEMIKDLLSGKCGLEEVTRNRIEFVELNQYESEPNLYFDWTGKFFTEEQKLELIMAANKRAGIVWIQISTYDSTISL